MDSEVTFYQFGTTFPPSETQLDVELTSIAQDSDGFLWLASPRGLIRFDGMDTRIYRTSEFPAVLSNRPSKLFMQSDGALLIASEKGLTRYNGRTFAPVVSGESWSSTIQAIAEDDQNRIWLGTDAGLFRVEGERASAVFEDSLSQVNSLLWHEGRMFVGTKGAVHVVSGAIGTKLALPESLAEQSVSDLELYNGEIWGATPRGLFSFDTQNQLTIEIDEKTESLHLEHLLADRDGSLWFGGTKNVGRHLPNGKMELPSMYNEEFGIGPELAGMIEGPSGEHWHVSRSYGLIGMYETPAMRTSFSEGLTSTSVTAVTGDATNSIFVATDKGIDFLSGHTVKNIVKEDFTSTGLVRTLFADSNKQLYVGTDRGLKTLDLYSSSWIDSTPERIIKAPVNAVLQNRSRPDELWVGTDSGLQKLTPFTRTNMAQADGLTIHVLMFNGDVLWLGTNKGLASFHNEKLTFHAENLSDSIASVVSLAVLPGGDVVAASANNGILVQHGSQWLSFNESDGLPSESVFRVDVHNDTLILTTGAGTFGVPHATLKSKVDKLVVTPVMTNKGYRASHITFCCRGSNHSDAALVGDTTVTASSDGILMLDLNEAKSNQTSPKPYIKATYTNDTRIEPDTSGKINLARDQRRMRIEFSALDLVNGPRLEFRYRLRGLDEQWVNMGKVRNAQLQNLPAGEFTFELQASPTAGVWSTQTVSLHIVRHPSFVETAYFKLLVIGLIAGVILFLIWLRSAAARRRHYRLEVAIRKRTEKLAVLNSELAQRNTDLRIVSETDKLTGLVNRRCFETKIASGKINQQHSGSGLLIVLDIDHFKKVNDTHGHAAGDSILSQFADALRASTRQSDLVARWGGEEFLIMCGCTESESHAVLNRVVAEIRNFHFSLPNGETLQVSASVGAVHYPLWGRAPLSEYIAVLFELADSAMYAVKTQGRNGWALFENGLAPDFVVDENNVERLHSELISQGSLTWSASDDKILPPTSHETASFAAVNQ